MSHYFIHDENMESNVTTIEYEFGGYTCSFKTDNGLFSKEHVDYATNILLHQLPELHGKVLDLGCGYGPIGIILSKVNDIRLTMVDVNPKAIEFSRENCRINGVDATFIESDGFAGVEDVYDAIVLNPPIHAGKKTIYEMYEMGRNHLTDGGRFYIVIQKKHGALSSIEKLGTIYETCNILYKKKGFFVLECVKG